MFVRSVRNKCDSFDSDRKPELGALSGTEQGLNLQVMGDLVGRDGRAGEGRGKERRPQGAKKELVSDAIAAMG